MSEILDHDCNGRPLRLGDRVTVVDTMNHRHYLGVVCTITGTGTHIIYGEVLTVDIKNDFGTDMKAVGESLKRVDDEQFQPADEEFTDMLKGLLEKANEIKRLPYIAEASFNMIGMERQYAEGACPLRIFKN